ncbi:hypothetical protein PENTCL1PPCAC_10324, partial [Pristionchus entomophagus]
NLLLHASPQNCQEMRFTCAVRAIIRSRKDAIKDMKTSDGIMMRFSPATAENQPANAQPFSVSSRGNLDFVTFSEALCFAEGMWKDSFLRTVYHPPGVVTYIMDKTVNPKWLLHSYRYRRVQKVIPSREVIVQGSQYALQRILGAIRKRNLSPLAPLCLDDSILSEIAKKSNLSSLTDRQLSCLGIIDDDFIGVDGILDRWKKLDLLEDDPSGLLSSLRIGKSAKHNKRYIAYSVDFLAILKKKILASKCRSLPPPKEFLSLPAPKAYRLPYVRYVYARVEFAQL